MAGHLKNESFPHKGNEKYFTRLKREEEGWKNWWTTSIHNIFRNKSCVAFLFKNCGMKLLKLHLVLILVCVHSSALDLVLVRIRKMVKNEQKKRKLSVIVKTSYKHPIYIKTCNVVFFSHFLILLSSLSLFFCSFASSLLRLSPLLSLCWAYDVGFHFVLLCVSFSNFRG